MEQFNQAIILAAGKGTRMNSILPKCAVSVLGKPMIVHIVDALIEASIKNIVVVVGYKKEVIIDLLKDYKEVKFTEQIEQLGTGHACLMGLSQLNKDVGSTIILPGDMPLIGSSNISLMMNIHNEFKNDMTILSCIFDNPFSYGRLIRNKDNNVIKIVEELDATEEERKVKEINTGLYIVKTNLLCKYLPLIDNNNKKAEYYLTDIVKLLSDNYKIDTCIKEYDYHLMGINDLDSLAKIEELAKK